MKTSLHLLLLSALLAVACEPKQAQQNPTAETQNQTPVTAEAVARFEDPNMNMAYQHYLHVKNALVAADFAEAQNGAKSLQASLSTVAKGENTVPTAPKMTLAPTLEAQRALLSPLSQEMATLLKAHNLSSGNAYLDFCPMANNGEGGFWISNEKAIKNPFFGNQMLTCGSIKETFN